MANGIRSTLIPDTTNPQSPVADPGIRPRLHRALLAAIVVAVGILGTTPTAFDEDPAARARRLVEEAEQLAAFDLGRSDRMADAVARFKEAAEIADRVDDRALGARAWTRLGLGYFALTRFADAETATRRGIAMARAAGLPAVGAAGHRLLGNMFLRAMRGDDAREAFRESVRLARQSGSSDDVVRSLANLCNLELEWGHIGDAITYARDAVAELDRAAARRVGITPRAKYTALVNLGLALRDAGDYGEAGAYLERALDAARGGGDVVSQNRVQRYLAEWYLVQGDAERAERFYRRAIAPGALPHEFQNPDIEAHALSGLAAPLAVLRGEWTEAASALAKATAIWEEQDKTDRLAATLPKLGHALMMAGDRRAARTALDRAVAFAESARRPRVLTEAHRQRGRLNAVEGRTLHAETDHRRALDVARANRLRPDEAAALVGLGEVAQLRGALREALAHLESAAAVVEAVRSNIGNPEHRATFAEAAHTTYASLYETHMRLHAEAPDSGHETHAFLAIERERAHDLRWALELAAAAARPTPRLESQRAAARRVSGLRAQLAAQALGDTQRRALLHQLDDAEREAATPAMIGSGGRVVAPPRDLESLRSALHEGEAVLAYAGAGDSMRVFVVTHDALRSVRVADAAGLDERADVFARLLAEGQSGEALRVGRTLARSLLAPALDVLPKGTRRLLVSATGGLAGLPFGALPVHEDAAAPAVPLLARYEVASLPSLSGLGAWRAGTRTPAPREVLALGDPLGDGRPLPAYTADLFQAARLGPLPASRREAESLLDARSETRDVLLGGAASEAALHRLPLHDYRVLHFATHAVIDPLVPARSAIVLAAGEDQDGLLQQREIFELDLAADLVVLSTCRSATGRAGRADGLQSLGRAFLHTGARSVVGTLWDVDDRATRQLVERFYAGLQRGAPVGASLQAAQRSGFGHDPWKNAREWAAFVVVGDPLAMPRLAAPSRPMTLTPWLAATGLVLLATLVLGYRMRKAVMRDSTATAPSRTPETRQR